MKNHGSYFWRNTSESNKGFTLVELLVVITIIGILIGLLLPAVQAIRESARRIQCANNIKQISLAAINYESSYERFPAAQLRLGHPTKNEAFVTGDMWSATLLPYIELQVVRDLYAKNLPDKYATGFEESWVGIQTAVSTWIPTYRCPSTADDDRYFGEYAYGPEGRITNSYLGCGSGTSWIESGDEPYVGGPQSDGMMLIDNWIKAPQVTDGLSNTVFFGESFSSIGVLEQRDFDGSIQHVDHWYIWSADIIFTDIDASEVVGSTAARINANKIEDAHVNEKELSFGSFHRNGVNIAFVDGHVIFIRESIDVDTFGEMGTRHGGEVVSDF